MKIELAFPDPALNPNQSKGRHWSVTSGLRKIAHYDAFLQTRRVAGTLLWRPTASEIPVTITFIQPDRRKRDRDNLLAALKCSLDGVAAALGVDDSQFEPMTIRRQYGKKPGAVHIEIFHPPSIPQPKGKL